MTILANQSSPLVQLGGRGQSVMASFCLGQSSRLRAIDQPLLPWECIICCSATRFLLYIVNQPPVMAGGRLVGRGFLKLGVAFCHSPGDSCQPLVSLANVGTGHQEPTLCLPMQVICLYPVCFSH